MSLRSKILLTLLGVAGLYALLDNGILRFFATRSFAAWELDEAEDRLEQVKRAYEQQASELRSKCAIWAHRDDVLRLVTGGGVESIAPDLGPEALEASGVDFLYLCAPNGKVLWRSIRQPSDTGPLRIDVLPSEALNSQHFLLRYRDEDVSGLVQSDRGPLLVSSQPVRDPQGKGLSEPEQGLRRALHGVVILGRFVDEEFLSRLVARRESGRTASPRVDDASLELSITPENMLGDAGNASPERAELIANLHAGEKEFAAEVGSDGRLHVFHLIPDVRTGESLVIEGSTEREIYGRGLRYVRYALLSTLASALFLLLVMLRLLQGIVIRPLGSLTRKATDIGRTDDTTIRVGLRRKDEIGQLAAEFDRMLDKLAHSRSQVVRTARLAGMSEIATGVLHNVGNVLNSVNVSANLIRAKLEQLPVADLTRLAAVLREHERDLSAFVHQDPRGKHLVPFLAELSAALSAEKEALRAEVRVLESGIGHVADLVRSQQTFAGTRGVFEYASLEHEVEAALVMCEQAMGKFEDVEIVREYEELPSIQVDKHKLLEILVNLIQNARQALEGVHGRPRRLTLRIRRPGEGRARIEVEDNGVGIPEENLTRIFRHGFTTKKDGHGFGLHVSANAATEMNSRLGVRSEGPGRGATFHIDLPFEAPVLVAA